MNNLVISEASKAWDISSGAIYGFTDADGWIEQPTAVGSVIKLKGRVNTVNDLPSVAEEGWLYFVGSSSATEFEEYVYTSDGRWEALGYSGITIDAALSDTSENPVQNKVVTLALAGKVDKVNGKGLSTNDFTDVEKTKLAGIESGANKTVVDDKLDATSTNPVQNKTIVSALRNGSPVHYGFKIDKNNSDPFTCVTYLYDNVGFTPAAMDYTNEAFNYGSWADAFFIKNSYPVALKFDGTEDYKLDPNDYSKKLDGTESDVTDPTYHGNFMVAFPTVWFKRYDDGDYNYVEISDVKLGDDWFAYAHTNANGDVLPYIYLPLYKGGLYDGKLRSISGAAPQNNTTADEEVSYAAACGQGWQIWDWSSRELINDLLILIGKSTDCQTTFGAGQESGYNTQAPNNGILNTGSLDDKGAFYGYNTSLSDVKVFGIGGFWASRWERLQGLMLVDDIWKAKMTPAYNFTGAGFATPENAVTPSGSEGYVKSRNTSAYGSIPAANSGASQTTYVCDYSYKNASGTRVAVVGGHCSNGRKAGCFYVYVSAVASRRDWNIGASAVYKSPR